MHQQKSLSGFKITDTSKGEFEAVFAVLDVKDHDGDVTVKGAFENGSEVRVSAYNHKSWDGVLPVGKGVIAEQGDQVVIKGRFFMETEAGRDTFTVVKEMGELQEWSYGYDTLEEEKGTKDGSPVNVIKKQKVYEVSPVILGAGIGTRTTAIKSRVQGSEKMKQLYSEVYYLLRDIGRDRFHAGNGRYVSVQDFDIDDDYVIYRVVDDEAKFIKLSYTRDADGGVSLGTDEEEVEVATSYVTAREKGKDDEPSTKDKGSEDEPGTEVKGKEDEPETKKEETEPEVKSEDEPEVEVKSARQREIEALTREEDGLKVKTEGFSAEQKQLYSEIMDELRNLGRDRYNAGTGRWVYVEDFDVDDSFVIYCVCQEGGEDEYFKVAYTRGEGDEAGIALADTEEEVERETSYVTAKSAPEGGEVKGKIPLPGEDGPETLAQKGTYLSRLEDGDAASEGTKDSPSKPGLKFSEHISAVMTDIDELTERAASVVTLRAEKGKKRLGDESHTLLKELTTRMETLKSLLEKCNDDAELSTVDRAYLDTIAGSLD